MRTLHRRAQRVFTSPVAELEELAANTPLVARRKEQREGLGDAADWEPAVLDALAKGR